MNWDGFLRDHTTIGQEFTVPGLLYEYIPETSYWELGGYRAKLNNMVNSWLRFGMVEKVGFEGKHHRILWRRIK